MITTFDVATGTYSNGMRVGDFVSYTNQYSHVVLEGVVEPPPSRHISNPNINCWGIWSFWGQSTDLCYLPEGMVTLVSRVDLEILGDNDDDCV